MCIYCHNAIERTVKLELQIKLEIWIINGTCSQCKLELFHHFWRPYSECQVLSGTSQHPLWNSWFSKVWRISHCYTERLIMSRNDFIFCTHTKGSFFNLKGRFNRCNSLFMTICFLKWVIYWWQFKMDFFYLNNFIISTEIYLSGFSCGFLAFSDVPLRALFSKVEINFSPYGKSWISIHLCENKFISLLQHMLHSTKVNEFSPTLQLFTSE